MRSTHVPDVHAMALAMENEVAVGVPQDEPVMGGDFERRRRAGSVHLRHIRRHVPEEVHDELVESLRVHVEQFNRGFEVQVGLTICRILYDYPYLVYGFNDFLWSDIEITRGLVNGTPRYIIWKEGRGMVVFDCIT
ncbi:hypothetical protein GCK72_024049 [Caenorhabditis remanei]|uniref:Uncharacterized protein n=1 Tax=Caenorhabditis remanei TaxID=31234 RepID=A0A6A5FYN5_CAERE|nr:hypothetical protein GCK72_024049 [Caenorhabditis remanei]KAF1747584.1 hypothetical protein GCK72_024049 [Caenorhabditis remanei]